MCWPHVQRDCEKRIKTIRPKELSEEIMSDIASIQLGQTRQELVDSFLSYYYMQWVISTESNWYAGAWPIDHNDGVEATNGDIKQNQIIRNKHEIGAFIMTF